MDVSSYHAETYFRQLNKMDNQAKEGKLRLLFDQLNGKNVYRQLTLTARLCTL